MRQAPRARQAQQRRASLQGGPDDLAIEDFKQAKEFDPSLTNARLYLATAYASQYIPGAPSDDNVRMGKQSHAGMARGPQAEIQEILNAIDGIGSILYNMASTPFDPKKMEESKAYHEKHIQIKARRIPSHIIGSA